MFKCLKKCLTYIIYYKIILQQYFSLPNTKYNYLEIVLIEMGLTNSNFIIIFITYF